MKKSAPSAPHKLRSSTLWVLLAFTFCLIVIPAAAVRSARETSSIRETSRMPGGLLPNFAPTLFSAQPSVLPAGTTINVNSTLQSPGNSGDCTLGEAILAANQNVPIDGCTAGSGVDTIMLPAGTYTLTTINNTHERVGPLGLPIIFSDVIIQGAGAANTIIERDQNAPDFGLLALPDPYFNPGAGLGSLVLSDVTMRGGRAFNPGGGAISAGDRTVTLNNVTFDKNVAYTGGAIDSFGYATINANNCIFTNNRASGSGGAIAAPYLTITKSTFNGNSAVYGGAIGFAQGGSAIARIVHSTFINNSVT